MATNRVIHFDFGFDCLTHLFPLWRLIKSTIINCDFWQFGQLVNWSIESGMARRFNRIEWNQIRRWQQEPCDRGQRRYCQLPGGGTRSSKTMKLNWLSWMNFVEWIYASWIRNDYVACILFHLVAARIAMIIRSLIESFFFARCRVFRVRRRKSGIVYDAIFRDRIRQLYIVSHKMYMLSCLSSRLDCLYIFLLHETWRSELT